MVIILSNQSVLSNLIILNFPIIQIILNIPSIPNFLIILNIIQ